MKNQKEIPILFGTIMVQAIFAGRKTMTRRIIKNLPEGASDELVQVIVSGHHEDYGHVLCPYGKPGDILWVRESFRWSDAHERYEFKGSTFDPEQRWPSKWWKPSIHMPKAAARIWLQVEEVRVERLYDISEEDAIAEGVNTYRSEIDNRPRYKDYLTSGRGYGHPDYDYPTVGVAVTSFSTLWRSINGMDSWEPNPWLWVVKFKVLSTDGRPNFTS